MMGKIRKRDIRHSVGRRGAKEQKNKRTKVTCIPPSGLLNCDGGNGSHIFPEPSQCKDRKFIANFPVISKYLTVQSAKI